MVNQFSIAKNTQCDSQSYGAEQSEEGDRGFYQEKRECKKGRVQSTQELNPEMKRDSKDRIPKGRNSNNKKVTKRKFKLL